MMDDYTEARVVMSPNGELLMALPIYADQKGVFIEEKAVENLLGVKKISIGIYERFGYLLYHPNQPYSFYMQSLELFEDLGELK